MKALKLFKAVVAGIFLLGYSLITFAQSTPVAVASGTFSNVNYVVYLVTNGITWSNAEASAEAAGGRLASVTSAGAEQYLYSLISSNAALWVSWGGGNQTGPWLGAYRQPSGTGSFQWVDGAPFTYADWASGQPDNYGGDEDHIEFLNFAQHPANTWNDAPNDVAQDAYHAGVPNPDSYIVEFVPPPPPAPVAVVSGTFSNVNYVVYLVTNGITWSNAEANAEAAGGQLASVTSAGAEAYLYSLISSNAALWVSWGGGNQTGPWLGAYRQPSGTGSFQWVDGAPFSYTSWASGQPDDYGGDEDHIEFLNFAQHPANTWNDAPNDVAQDAYHAGVPNPDSYIVEFVPPPPPPAPVAVVSGTFSNVNYVVYLVTNGITWSNAEASAEAAGGRLASVTSAGAEAYLYSLISSNAALWVSWGGGNQTGPWLGAYRQPSGTGSFQWVDGAPFSYTSWASGQPDDYGGDEDHIEFLNFAQHPANTWNDAPNDVAQDAYHAGTPNPDSYIVEFVPPPPPAPVAVASGTFSNVNYVVYLVTNGITWSNAEASAEAAGGQLASVTSAGAEAYLYSLISSNAALWVSWGGGNQTGPWLGAYRQPSGTGSFQWVDGAPFSYTSWASGQPDNYGGDEDHIEFLNFAQHPANTWNDAPNDVAQDAYHAGVPNPDSYIVEFVPPYDAIGTAVLLDGSVAGITIINRGSEYTNTPNVLILGGGGSGAQAVAVISNGMVIAIQILNGGSGYTNTPQVLIAPPFIAKPSLKIAPATFLVFSNLTIGSSYQLQQAAAWYWTNQPASFIAQSCICTQIVPGTAACGSYQLISNPAPLQAFAMPQLANGSLVGAVVINGGSGYATTPPVKIVGGGGTNATACLQISGGVVTAISISDGGAGYTTMPTIEIGQPPASAISPTVWPAIRLDFEQLTPYDNYQIQFKPDFGGTWQNWTGGAFCPTNTTSSQFLLFTNSSGFFRLQHLP